MLKEVGRALALLGSKVVNCVKKDMQERPAEFRCRNSSLIIRVRQSAGVYRPDDAMTCLFG
jgi:hypothetical protein